MASIGYATLDVIPTFKGLRRQLEQGSGSEMAAAGRAGGRRFGDAAAAEAGGRFKSRMGGIVKEVFAPAAGIVAGAGLVAGFKDIIVRASEAEQAVGGVQAVFGSYADQVVADSKRANDALGLSRTEYQELVTLSGALLKNKGLSDFAGQAASLVKVGADLAAQFGGSTKDAVDALNAALRGESDPIERYAISLNETAVNAELAARGQSKLKGAALEQAKTQARLAIIQKQSADAQGAFARESDTLAGKQARLSAEWANMRTELGEKLLPATADFVGFLNGEALPALSATGGAVADAARFFNGLPSPIKAATGALVAFRVAQAAGVTGLPTRGMGVLSDALETTRVRALLASDAYRQARAGQIEIGSTAARYTPGVGRFAAALSAVRVGAQGAGGALRKGLGGAVSLLGGPWGVAFAGGAAVLGHFYSENQKAKQYVDDLTGSLDKQTGAVTKNSQEIAFDALKKSGAIKAAKTLGLNLEDVRDAALGESGALRALNAELDKHIFALNTSGSATNDHTGKQVEASIAAQILQEALNDSSGAVATARTNIKDYGTFMGGAAQSTRDAGEAASNSAGGFTDLASQASAAGDAVKALLKAENDRRAKNLADRQDALALRQQLAETRREAREGKATLDTNVQEGRDNLSALYDLAEQFNNSSAKVRNTKGAYREFRKDFIEVARSMGAGRDRARELADSIIKVPKRAATKVETPGMDKALRDFKRLQLMALEANSTRQFQVSQRRRGAQRTAFATGGRVGGHGIGDKRMILADPREWVINPRAVNYYGDGLMDAINKMRLPRYAEGGPVGQQVAVAPVHVKGGATVTIGQVVAHSYDDFLAQAQQRASNAQYGGIH